jgi:hypothetical protein
MPTCVRLLIALSSLHAVQGVDTDRSWDETTTRPATHIEVHVTRRHNVSQGART